MSEPTSAASVEPCPSCSGKMDIGLWYCFNCQTRDTDGAILAALKKSAGVE